MDMRVQLAASTLILGLASAALALPAAGQTQPGAPAGSGPADSPAGHGDVAVVYLDNYSNGMWYTPHFKFPIGTVRDRGIGIDASYNISSDWSIFGGIRYFHNELDPPGMPEQQTSAWQDFTLGAAWHMHFDGLDFTPSVSANIPSHDYPIIGDAYTGQNLNQLLLAATLSHQFDFTSIYYKLGYGYAFSEHVLGVDTGYQRADAELGWFVNDRFTLRAFLTGRDGFGVSLPEYKQLFAARGSQADANKVRIAEHSYHAWGLGFDYAFGNRCTASLSAQHMFWGNLANDLKFGLEARLTRSF
jgi:hypothetical protein